MTVVVLFLVLAASGKNKRREEADAEAAAMVCWIRRHHQRNSATYLEVLRLMAELVAAVNQAAAQPNSGDHHRG